MDIYELKLKRIEYNNKKLFVFDNLDNEKINEYSQFYLASITKLFTCFTIILLHQNKIIDIYDKVDKYIKSNKNNDFSKITIFNLLNHEGHIIRDLNEKKLIYNNFVSSTKIMDKFINDKIIDINYTGYSNMGYLLLGCIIEKVTNMTYIDAFKKYILEPLKMNNTNVGKTNMIHYIQDKPIKKAQIASYFNGTTVGALYSCIYDLLKFGKNIIKLLDIKSINILQKITFIYTTFNDDFIIHHSGIWYGTQTYLYIKFNKSWKYKEMYISFKTNKLFI
jgi:CubicO group peptidase (beta-lactamase class C family)